MKIETYNNKYNNIHSRTSTPSFGAIHPALYFEKVGEDSYKLITDNDLIKNTLQKNIITWLNRNYNARIKESLRVTSKLKPETPETAATRARIVKFFTNRDPDYRQTNEDRASSYFNTDSVSGLLRSYIFTGKSVELLNTQVQKIKQVQSDIKRLAQDLQTFYGFKFSEAKARATKELEQQLGIAKSGYHDSVLNILKSKEAKLDPNNTLFLAFFEPVTKGKKTSYKLINADFQQRLV